MALARKLKGTLTISRTTSLIGEEPDKHTCSISIRDRRSNNVFFHTNMSLEQFAHAIFGLAEVPITMVVKSLPDVGKYVDRRHVTIRLTRAELRRAKLQEYNKELLEQWLKDNCQRKGWHLSSYLGSQTSVTSDGHGGIAMRVSYYRYVKDKAELKRQRKARL